jgi:short-subunit dehydrogenase
MASSFATRWPAALVTGASSGIGRAFAVALAGRGCQVVAVARRKDRLEELAEATGAEALVADLTDPVDLASVEDRLSNRSRPIDLLVNNAGFGGSGPFVRQPLDHEDREVRLNVLAPVHLTSAALPGMVERGRGGIVNVSSMAGVQALPFLATYSATKAYLTSFSQSLHEEVRPYGVNVLAVLPGMTRTEFHQTAGLDRSMVPRPAWLTAEEVVEAALSDLERGRAVCIPRAGYRVLATVSRMAPRVLNRKVSAVIGRRL